MKVIDLLNMAAKGEELPKKVKIRGAIWSLDEFGDMYSTVDETPYGKEQFMLTEVLDGLFSESQLNEEVKVL